MPGFYPQFGDRVKARVVCSAGNQIGENVLYYVPIFVTTGGCELMEMSLALSILLEGPYKAAMQANSTYRGVGCTNLTNPATVEYADSSLAGPGVTGSAMGPTQTAAVIRKSTGVGGRKGRGRSYIPFPYVEAFTTVGGMAAAYLTQLEAIAAATPLLLVVTGATGETQFQQVLYSRTNPTAFSPITSYTAVGLWGTQRRRGQYGRQNVIPF